MRPDTARSRSIDTEMARGPANNPHRSEIRMLRLAFSLLAVAFLLVPPPAPAATWTEGTNYVRVTPPQQTTVPAGKVEVMEVFSYGCPVCNAFQPVMEKLRHSLPPNAQLVLLPASCNNAAEDWP